MSIPRKDPNFTMKELRKAAEHFRAAGYRYWEAMHRAGIPSGAIAWVQSLDGSLVLFTRGEYLDTLLKNIPEIGPTTFFGGTDEFK
jgi:hypothetical protein